MRQHRPALSASFGRGPGADLPPRREVRAGAGCVDGPRPSSRPSLRAPACRRAPLRACRAASQVERTGWQAYRTPRSSGKSTLRAAKMYGGQQPPQQQRPPGVGGQQQPQGAPGQGAGRGGGPPMMSPPAGQFQQGGRPMGPGGQPGMPSPGMHPGQGRGGARSSLSSPNQGHRR